MSQIPPQLYGSVPPQQPYQRRRVDFESIGVAWKIISSDFGTWAVASLITLMILLILMIPAIGFFYVKLFQLVFTMQPGVGGRPNPFAFLQIFELELMLAGLSLFVQPIQYIFLGGMSEMALRQMEGIPIAATDVFLGFRKFGSLYITGFCYTAAIFVGLLFFYVPGFIFAGLFCFAPILIIRGKAKAVDALVRSWQILVGDLWMIALLLFCAQLLAGLGVFACYIGLIFTMPISSVVVAITYRNFFPPNLQPTEGPRA
ncbi:MAG TPA: hypothetical protein VGL56_06910 [Fimbriimonadaceae bacterium]|jgi:uncharacterized membrane protein